jgi:hypothetical protein
MIREYAKQFPNGEGDTYKTFPILIVDIHQGCTLKSVAAAILTAMGDPGADTGTRDKLMAKAKERLKDCKVELLVFDEAHHLIDNKTDKIESHVSDWIKTLLNFNACPILLAGIPMTRRVLSNNIQLRRRCLATHHIRPFAYVTTAEQQDFRLLLKAFDDRLPFPKPSKIAEDPKISKWLHDASGGYVGRLFLLLYRACIDAIDQKAESLTWDHLQAALEPSDTEDGHFLAGDDE